MKAIKILLIDNSYSSRTILKKSILKNHNYDLIGEAKSKEEGIELLKQTKADLIILNNNIANKTGFNMAKELLKQNPDFKILLISNEFIESLNEEIKNIENLEFFVKEKTLNADLLFEKIDNLFSKNNKEEVLDENFSEEDITVTNSKEETITSNIEDNSKKNIVDIPKINSNNKEVLNEKTEYHNDDECIIEANIKEDDLETKTKDEDILVLNKEAETEPEDIPITNKETELEIEPDNKDIITLTKSDSNDFIIDDDDEDDESFDLESESSYSYDEHFKLDKDNSSENEETFDLSSESNYENEETFDLSNENNDDDEIFDLDKDTFDDCESLELDKSIANKTFNLDEENSNEDEPDNDIDTKDYKTFHLEESDNDDDSFDLESESSYNYEEHFKLDEEENSKNEEILDLSNGNTDDEILDLEKTNNDEETFNLDDNTNSKDEEVFSLDKETDNDTLDLDLDEETDNDDDFDLDDNVSYEQENFSKDDIDNDNVDLDNSMSELDDNLNLEEDFSLESNMEHHLKDSDLDFDFENNEETIEDYANTIPGIEESSDIVDQGKTDAKKTDCELLNSDYDYYNISKPDENHTNKNDDDEIFDDYLIKITPPRKYSNENLDDESEKEKNKSKKSKGVIDSIKNIFKK